MNIAIVDDNKEFVASFKAVVEKICIKNKVEAETEVFDSAFSVVENYSKYHIIFLDIDMPHFNGFEAAEKINGFKKPDDFPYIVFVTCNDNLVFSALKRHPYSFIRKSDLFEECEACILLIEEKVQADIKRYPVKTGRKTVFISLNSIYYLEKDKNYILYYTKNGVIRERATMDEKAAELESSGFVRTHIGYLVNYNHISEIATDEIILDDSSRIPISKRYRAEVKQKYYSWLVNYFV